MTAERVTDWLTETGVQEALTEADHRARFDPEELAAAVHALTEAVDRVNRATVGSEALPWTDLATLLDALREARKTAQAVESNLETRTARAMVDADVKQVELDGVGVVEWRAGKTRKSWLHDDLAAAVIDHHLSDRADGELPTPWEVRDWLFAAAAPSYWRVTALRALGLEPDDYCETSPGRASVSITRPG